MYTVWFITLKPRVPKGFGPSVFSFDVQWIPSGRRGVLTLGWDGGLGVQTFLPMRLRPSLPWTPHLLLYSLIFVFGQGSPDLPPPFSPFPLPLPFPFLPPFSFFPPQSILTQEQVPFVYDLYVSLPTRTPDGEWESKSFSDYH